MLDRQVSHTYRQLADRLKENPCIDLPAGIRFSKYII